MESTIKEKDIKTSPEPVSFKGTETILDQMNNSICRIYTDNGKGTGFFTKIPYKLKLLPVLITNNHVINQDDILNNKKFSIYLNNDKKIKRIELDNNRLKYTNEKLDITIIEIKDNDKLNNKYLKTTKEGSSGSPILLINNQKLIGIHYGSSKQYDFNKGRLLIYSIIEFENIKNNLLLINKEGKYLNYNNKNNYIIAEFEIKNDNEKIRIINSYEQYNRGWKNINYKKEYENEKEIKDNCEIYINDKLIPFSYLKKENI